MFDIFKKVFGTKQDRDVKGYSGRVDEINEYFDQYKSLSLDDLRGKTLEFRSRIKEHLAGIDEDIRNLKAESEQEDDLLQREELYTQIDALTKERDEHLEDILRELLPEAFAVVKETSRRFSENATLQVRTTDRDRDLAATRDYVTVNGDVTTWKNSWQAEYGAL